MPYIVPTPRAIAFYDRTRDTEQQTTAATNIFDLYDANVGKMYPEKTYLPQGVKDAIRYSDRNTY